MSKIAWVLGGGGAKGSYEVGVLKQLTEKGIIPDAVYGTSVGGLNASGFAFSGIKELERIWRKIRGQHDIVTFQLKSLWLGSRGLFSTLPLRKLAEEIINDSLPAITPTVVMTNIETGSLAYITPENVIDYQMRFVDAVIASASMPFIMEPVKQIWVDGGIRETVPLQQAITEGADEIYVIICNPWTRNLEKPSGVGNWIQVALHMIDILTHEIFVNDIQACLKKNSDPETKTISIHLFAPGYFFTDTMDFAPENIDVGIKMGYAATEIGHEFVRGI